MRVFSKIVLILVLLIALGFVAREIREAKTAKLSTHLRSDENIKVLILGDSHAVAGIDPDYIPDSANWAQVGEELEYSYYKLVHATRAHAPKELILSCSYFNFLAPNDTEWEMQRRYHPLLDKEFYQAKSAFREMDASIRYHYLKDILMPAYLPIGILNDVALLYGSPNFIGAYDRRRGSTIGDIRSLHKAVSRHYYDGNGLREISALRVYFFDKIISHCQAHDIRLWVVNTPLHPEYTLSVPPQISRPYYEIIKDRHEHFRFLDHSSMSLPNEMFFDYDHLNHHGAQLLSDLIAADLQTDHLLP